MRLVSLLNFSKHPSYSRCYSYFSKANLENVNQDINKIAQGTLWRIYDDVFIQILLISVVDEAQSIVVMAGAGLSTASGIPDFRSPNTGIYANLQKYNLPYPEAIFEIDYFKWVSTDISKDIIFYC